MSEHERTGTERAPGWWDDLLSPQAAAITAFTLAALAMTGQGAWTGFAQALFGSNFPPSALGAVLASGFLATLVVEGLAFWFARRAMAEPAVHDTWAGHLARAAVLLAVVGTGFSVLALLASLVLRTG